MASICGKHTCRCVVVDIVCFIVVVKFYESQWHHMPISHEYFNTSLIPRPLPDFILQLWRNTDFSFNTAFSCPAKYWCVSTTYVTSISE